MIQLLSHAKEMKFQYKSIKLPKYMMVFVRNRNSIQ